MARFDFILVSAAALALAGCSADRQAPAPAESLVPLPSAQPPPPAPGPDAAGTEAAQPADECGAGKLGGYLNQLPSNDAMAGIRKAIGHDRVRTIKPGDAVTMDFRPDRLNIEIGQDGRIKLFRCG